MAKGIATRSSRGHRTICVPISEELYPQIVSDPQEFRRTLDERFRVMPELFPKNFAAGYQLKDSHVLRPSGASHNPPHPLERRLVIQRPPLLPHALHDRADGARPSTVVPPQVRCPVLCPGLRFRT